MDMRRAYLHSWFLSLGVQCLLSSFFLVQAIRRDLLLSLCFASVAGRMEDFDSDNTVRCNLERSLFQ